MSPTPTHITHSYYVWEADNEPLFILSLSTEAKPWYWYKGQFVDIPRAEFHEFIEHSKRKFEAKCYMNRIKADLGK